MTKQLTLQEKAEALISIWSKDPILGVRQLFGVDPTKQQIDLILSADIYIFLGIVYLVDIS